MNQEFNATTLKGLAQRFSPPTFDSFDEDDSIPVTPRPQATPFSEQATPFREPERAATPFRSEPEKKIPSLKKPKFPKVALGKFKPSFNAELPSVEIEFLRSFFIFCGLFYFRVPLPSPVLLFLGALAIAFFFFIFNRPRLSRFFIVIYAAFQVASFLLGPRLF